MQGMGVATYGQPSTVIGNTNQDVVQTLALVNIAGDELAREQDWEQMCIQYLFTATFYQYTGDTTVNSTSITNMSSIANLDSTFQVTGTGINQDTQVVSASSTTVVINQAAAATGTSVNLTFSKVLFAPPTGFDRLIDRTNWDRSKHWEMMGPKTAQEWEWLKSGWISTGPRIRYRKFGGYFAIWPPLGATERLAFEYVTKYWILATGGTSPTKQLFTADTDTTVFPDPLMRALIRLKYFEVKGFDTTALYRDYLTQRDIAKANDAGSPTLSMAPKYTDPLITINNLPDSGYGQ